MTQSALESWRTRGDAPARIERAGCFKYENVTGAVSAALPDHVPEEVKEERWHRFMQAQSEIADTRAQAMVGRRSM
jgi:ribosomal protein S12 methylthiotransferase